MCDFFTCIVTTFGDVLFTEEDSHDTVIERYGFIDDLKCFVRVEYTPIGGYIIDEKSIPEWYERMAAKARKDVKATYNKVASAHRVMMVTRIKAFKEYEASTTEVGKVKVAPDPLPWLKYRRIRIRAIRDYKDKIENIKGYLSSDGPTYIYSSVSFYDTP